MELRLSAAETELALTLIRRWMDRLGFRSIDELALSAENVKRSTLYRWFAAHERGYQVRIRVRSLRDLIDALKAKEDSGELTRDFEALLRDVGVRVAEESALIRECRRHGVSFQRVLAAVRGARCRIVRED